LGAVLGGTASPMVWDYTAAQVVRAVGERVVLGDWVPQTPWRFGGFEGSRRSQGSKERRSQSQLWRRQWPAHHSLFDQRSGAILEALALTIALGDSVPQTLEFSACRGFPGQHELIKGTMGRKTRLEARIPSKPFPLPPHINSALEGACLEHSPRGLRPHKACGGLPRPRPPVRPVGDLGMHRAPQGAKSNPQGRLCPQERLEFWSFRRGPGK
jgi:hypothetical protein